MSADIPLSERISPDEHCEKCGKRIIILYEAGDEQDTIFLGCPDADDNEHTEHNGQPRKLLQSWGWKI